MNARLALFGVAFAALAGMAGCAFLRQPAESPVVKAALEARACYLHALEPVLGDVAEPALQAIMAGGDPVAILRAHRVSVNDIIETAERFSACAAPEPGAPTES